jgi:hypothetical protein
MTELEPRIVQLGIIGSRWARLLTQATGNEWGGSIYRDSNGFYHLMPPIEGTHDSVPDQPVPPGTTLVGVYHSHPMPDLSVFDATVVVAQVPGEL